MNNFIDAEKKNKVIDFMFMLTSEFLKKSVNIKIFQAKFLKFKIGFEKKK